MLVYARFRGSRRRVNVPDSSEGGASSCIAGPSGRYSRTGTLRTLYAPSLSGTAEESVDGGRECKETWEGGGEFGRTGVVEGVIREAIFQYSSKLSRQEYV